MGLVTVGGYPGQPIQQFARDTQQGLQAFSALIRRAAYATSLGETFGGDRDLYTALGWKKDLVFQDYYNKYDRLEIAKRVINLPVKSTWKAGFTLVDPAAESGKVTKFVQEWQAMEKRLRLTRQMRRADRLTRVGQFGILLLGYDDIQAQAEFAQPVRFKLNPIDTEIAASPRNLIYTKALSENNITVAEFDKDVNSERYWLPKIYQIQFDRPDGSKSESFRVHWSRILHITEEIFEDETYGIPSLRSAFNRFDDIEKIIGGSAEMFWRGARPGYAANIDKDARMGTKDKADFQDQLKEWEHDLRRFLYTRGIEMQSLAPQISDPTQHFDIQISLIAAAFNIPKRILLGSERGELASSQDERNYYAGIQDRQVDHAEPDIVRPFIDRQIRAGLLPEVEDYEIQWPDLYSVNDEDQAGISEKLSKALTQYFKVPGAEDQMPFAIFLREVMKWNQTTVDEVVAYRDQLEGKEADQIEADENAIAEEGSNE